MSLHSLDAMLGELLGARYRIINILGSGGFGHTYIAEDIQRPGNPRCVLKHLTFASTNAEVFQQVRRLFQAEAETLERLGRHDQIPQLLAYFEENQEFYLVQEFIVGRPLSDELAGGVRFSESQVIALLEDILGILAYVHAQGVIHRDLKPDNLIRRQSDGKFVLIDFGAVKTIGTAIAETTGETNLSVPIYTSGYAASEQCLGRPQFNSDLYSLGMVALQTLTGMRPAQLPQDFHTSEIIWRDRATVNEALANFLDQMIRYHYIYRFQSATLALQALRQIFSQVPTLVADGAEGLGKATSATRIPTDQTVAQLSGAQPPKTAPRPKRKRLAIAGGAIAVLILGVTIARSIVKFPWDSGGSSPVGNPSMVAMTTNDRISLGEKLLSKWQPNPKKQEATERIAAGDFPAAIAALEAARQKDPNDPETLIYLNNARIGKSKAYLLAVAVPLGDAFGSSLEILRGVALAQDQINRSGGMNGVPLKLAIANDDNQKEIARQLAKTLASTPELLGVIGHGISDTTLAAAEVYQPNQIPMVSPLSSAVQLSNFGSYIFRVMPSDRLTAKALSDYMLNRLKKRKVVIFYNSASAYSKSLKTEFKDALFYNGVELLEEFDFSRPDFDPDESVEKAIAKGAEALMLAPDSEVSDRALQVVQLNRRRLQLLGGDTVSTTKLLKVVGKDAVGTVLAVPIDLSQSPFQQQSSQLWGKAAAITWRSALAYDATQALVAAMRRDPTRSGMQRTMTTAEFQAQGAKEPIRFLPTGDRKIRVYLVTVVPVQSGGRTRYVFKPLL